MHRPAASRGHRRSRRALATALLGLGAAMGAPCESHAEGGDFEARFAACLSCHGEKGRSKTPLTPSLGGQPAFFAMTQLFLLRDGRRGEPVMIEQARTMSNDDLRAFSKAISLLPPPDPPAEPPDAQRYDRGRELAVRRRCGVCHNPDYSGREQMPRLANQREDYLLKSMREFRSGARLGYGAAMTQELVGLSDDDLAALAHFLAYYRAPG